MLVLAALWKNLMRRLEKFHELIFLSVFTLDEIWHVVWIRTKDESSLTLGHNLDILDITKN